MVSGLLLHPMIYSLAKFLNVGIRFSKVDSKNQGGTISIVYTIIFLKPDNTFVLKGQTQLLDRNHYDGGSCFWIDLMIVTREVLIWCLCSEEGALSPNVWTFPSLSQWSTTPSLHGAPNTGHIHHLFYCFS